MQPTIGLIWAGALLVLGGVLFTAAKALRGGRLSEARESRPGLASDTLEPRRAATSLGLKANWPGLALIALGSLLLLAGAVV